VKASRCASGNAGENWISAVSGAGEVTICEAALQFRPSPMTIFDDDAYLLFGLNNPADYVTEVNRTTQFACNALWQMIVSSTQTVHNAFSRITLTSELLHINEEREFLRIGEKETPHGGGAHISRRLHSVQPVSNRT
jgi:hypothetical protein